MSAALNRLDLSTDRRAALVPLIEERMRRAHDGDADDVAGLDPPASNATRASSFALMRRARTTSPSSRHSISRWTRRPMSRSPMSTAVSRQPTCRWPSCSARHSSCASSEILHLVAFLRRAFDLMTTLERAGRWNDVISTVEGYHRLGDERRPGGPMLPTDRQGDERLPHSDAPAVDRHDARTR